MRPAPVGFQCPDCVAAAGATLQPGRTVAGGLVHDNPSLVTMALLVVNVAMFGLQLLTSDALTRWGALVGAPIALDGQWYRLFTAAFLHVSVMHLLFNMLALYVVGTAVEPRLGRARFLTVYVGSALAGSVLSYVVDPAFTATVGASGAVFGVFGALFVLALRLRFDIRGVIAVIVINAAIGFIPGLNINWRAHLGGLIAGALLTAAMVWVPKGYRVAAPAAAAVVLVVVSAAAVTWRTGEIRSCVSGDGSAGTCARVLR